LRGAGNLAHSSQCRERTNWALENSLAFLGECKHIRAHEKIFADGFFIIATMSYSLSLRPPLAHDPAPKPHDTAAISRVFSNSSGLKN